nr:hypothetical protein [Clostridia bacterium]
MILLHIGDPPFAIFGFRVGLPSRKVRHSLARCYLKRYGTSIWNMRRFMTI